MPNLGAPELMLILLIVVIVFGAGRLPEIGTALGKGIRDFKKGLNEEHKPEETAEAGETHSS